jgi:hypothetical protein
MSQSRDHRFHAGLAAFEHDAEDELDVTSVSHAEGAGHGMKEKRPISSEPAWLDPSNDRKSPYTDAEFERLADDQIAVLADTAAWRDLVAELGKQRARETVKQRLAGRDPNSLINWDPAGPLHSLICVQRHARRNYHRF